MPVQRILNVPVASQYGDFGGFPHANMTHSNNIHHRESTDGGRIDPRTSHPPSGASNRRLMCHISMAPDSRPILAISLVGGA